MNRTMIILFVILLAISIGLITLTVVSEGEGQGCKTSYPDKPTAKPRKTPLSELIKVLNPDDIIDQIILAIALIEQPRGGYNFNYWGVHTDIGKWSYSDLIEYRICLRESITGKTREYAGWSSVFNALKWMRKVIRQKYNNFLVKYGYFDFGRFYAEKWKGDKNVKSWWGEKFAQAGEMLKRRV
ncbi:MAG: hypothetical protein ABIL17_08565 [candidate division WOR-3 bacterium]